MATDYEITVKIRVTCTDTPLDNPKDIATKYALMATQFRAIGATQAVVTEIKKVEK